MKTAHLLIGFALLLAPAALAQADDTVTLNDGSIIKGQVMEETSDHVVLMDHGLKRTLDRSLVASVSFNSDASSSASSAAPSSAAPPSDGGNTIPSAPANPSGSGPDSGSPPADASGSAAGGTVPSMPSQEQQDYALGVSDYYKVPPDQVWGYEDMGLPFEELPVVYYLARRAGVDPGLVADYRTSGASYVSICMRLGLSPDIFYWDDIYSRDLGGPYSGVYYRYHHFYGHWYWDSLALTDADIINLVNLRFTSDYWHRPYWEVAGAYGEGHPFFYIGFGYSHTYGAPWRAHYGEGYGSGFSAYYGNHASSGHGYFGGRVALGGGVSVSGHASFGGHAPMGAGQGGGYAGHGGPPGNIPGGGHVPVGGGYAGHAGQGPGNAHAGAMRPSGNQGGHGGHSGGGGKKGKGGKKKDHG